jgi:hypothetical protein
MKKAVSNESKKENFKIEKVNVAAANKDFEILEDTVAPSWGINCRHGSFGIWCN